MQTQQLSQSQVQAYLSAKLASNQLGDEDTMDANMQAVVTMTLDIVKHLEKINQTLSKQGEILEQHNQKLDDTMLHLQALSESGSWNTLIVSIIENKKATAAIVAIVISLFSPLISTVYEMKSIFNSDNVGIVALAMVLIAVIFASILHKK